MMNNVYNKIRTSGGRLTQIKRAIVDILSEKKCLLTKDVIIDRLNAQKITPNRSTIYRELHFLEKNKIIIKNTILGIDHYEIFQDDHYHLVCMSCNMIRHIDIDNNLIKKEEHIGQKNDFNIINHSIDLYGHCHNCQK
jgi:Fur family transcriptional regulator, ferric uptake regulator